MEKIIEDLKRYKVAFLCIAAWIIITHICFGVFCPLLILTGIPCPGCGLTRAGVLILSGKFMAGITMNPSILIWIIYIFWFCIYRYILRRESKLPFYLLGFVCILTMLIYFYRMPLLFGKVEPYLYYKRNLLNRIM